MDNYRRFDYDHREPRWCDYDGGMDYHWEPCYDQGYRGDPNPGWIDNRFRGFENSNWQEDQQSDCYDWRDGNQGAWLYHEDREPPFWQQQRYFMSNHNDFQNDYATSFNYGGYQYYDEWEDFSSYQEPLPPPPQLEDTKALARRIQELSQAINEVTARFERRDRAENEQSQRLKDLDEQIAQLTSKKAAEPDNPLPTQPHPNLSNPLYPIHASTWSLETYYKDLENLEEEQEYESEGEEYDEREEVVSKVEEDEIEIEKEKIEEKESEKERGEIPLQSIEPPPPYLEEMELTAEDAALIKDYVASYSLEKLQGKEAHEEKKETELIQVPEIEEELLNTPSKFVEVPIEVMSESIKRDPSEVSRYGRKQHDLRENHTKQPGKGFKVKRKKSKLLFPSHFKSRWRDTFDGLYTISGLALGICANTGTPVQGKDDLRPP